MKKKALYENNNADQHLVVGSIEVLGDLKNKGITTIRRNISALQQENVEFMQQQNNYWQELADDRVITAVEKKTLYREFQNIQRSYAALEQQARNQNLEGTDAWKDYRATYYELRDFLNIDLKLFDEMEEILDLTPEQQQLFNQYFNNYYYSEKFTSIAISTGIISSLGFKVLKSLDDPGKEGEIGIYRGQLYQYVTDHWEAVGLEGYIGAFTGLPQTTSLNQYFLAIENFTGTEALLINGETLLVNDDQELYVDRKYEYSFIYSYNGNTWQKISDKNDYRYVVAMVDLVNYTGELPGVYQTAIDKVEQKIPHLPEYLHIKTTVPVTAAHGDYFVYGGQNYGIYEKSVIYRWNKDITGASKWEKLDPNSNVYSNYYMQALEDILTMRDVKDGYFAALFARSFFTHSASMDALSVNTIKLTGPNAAIQSNDEQYEWHKKGTRIDAAGNIDANGDTHIGGTVTIDGDGVIGGSMTVKGVMDAATGSMQDLTITGRSYFEGELNCGTLKVIRGTQYSKKTLFSTDDIIINLFDDLSRRGAGRDQIVSAASLFPDYPNSTLYYGLMVVTTVRLYVSELYQPFRATLFHVVFNEFMDIYDQMGGGATFINVPEDVDILYPIGEKMKFTLDDLPRDRPTEPNVVWVQDGILRLS